MSDDPEIARLKAENAELRRRIGERDRLERLLQATIEHIDGVIYLRDTDGVITHVNDMFLRLIGLPREEVVGRRDSDLFPKEVYEQFRVVDRQVVEERRTVTQEEHAPQADGVHVFLSRKYPVFDSAGALIGQGGISTDITEQRRAEATLQETRTILHAIVENAPLAILAIDRSYRYVLASHEAARQVGWAPAELPGQRVADVVPPDAAEALRAPIERVFGSGEPLVLEQSVSWQGDTRVLLSHMFPIRDGGGSADYVGIVASDVTEVRRTEAERLRLQQEIIQAQRSALLELSTPIIPIAEGVLAVPLIGEIDHERSQQIAGVLLERVSAAGADVVILDLTGVRHVEAAIVDAMMQTIRAVRLLGAEAVVTGISPAVAQAIAGLEEPLRQITVRQTLQHAVEHALARTRTRRG
ncbi:PAS domain-containing protein [Nannocystis pusilla]|uniref:PAS domain-containing protein n=1 Tax=Nannocystis pusilla TaxID=889268 RepID=A0ABS7TVK4_9BACT|nr:PAS domain-containing protein [Nannocystis pusilla]MBZ5712248.1 PAS domain-containing protein [Nannocystis pusilla]